MSAATVYLVGSGPGDAGLVTVRGLELLRRADAVVYDYLAPAELLDEVPAGAERVYVGKKGFSAHVTQGEINELIVAKAREVAERGGSCVVRLKGGDPFVFGRGGEEALALAEAGVPFQVVPGVTSGVAAPAYAGIPVTHRTVASTVTFVTGHEDPTKNESSVDWAALAGLASAGGTLCFYMGMRNLGLVSGRLQEQGLPAGFPVALVQWGTTARQRTLVSTLSAVEEEAREVGIGAPAIILVGEAAKLRDELSWFERRPLFARRFAVTRSRSQASGLVARLRELGADVIEFPTIAFGEPDDFGPLDEALARLGDYDWVVFTSVNGVDAFFERLDGDARSLAGARVAAIGPATAARLAQHGIVADVVPREYRGEAVFEAMRDADERLDNAPGLDNAPVARCPKAREAGGLGQRATGALSSPARVLVARAQEAREALPELLRGAGAEVDVAAAYKTVVPDGDGAAELARRLAAGDIDGVTFTSSSTARNLVALLGDDAAALRNATLFSIGPITSATLREAGFDDIVEASEYTIDGLLAAILEENE